MPAWSKREFTVAKEGTIELARLVDDEPLVLHWEKAEARKGANIAGWTVESRGTFRWALHFRFREKPFEVYGRGPTGGFWFAVESTDIERWRRLAPFKGVVQKDVFEIEAEGARWRFDLAKRVVSQVQSG